jgi:hypothetical protein
MNAWQNELVGKRVEQANAIAAINGWRIRDWRTEDPEMCGTCDYDPHRLNVETTANVVIRVLRVG